MIDHLIRVHGFNRQGIERETTDIQSNEPISSSGFRLATNLRSLQLTFNPDVFKDLLLRWIIMN